MISTALIVPIIPKNRVFSIRRHRARRHVAKVCSLTVEKEIAPLEQEAATRLTDFARACKAAARAVTLYPSTHPAIKASLSRLVDSATKLTSQGPVTFGVL